MSNPLLAKTSLVLFLNKIDILKAKLRSGIRFGDYIVSYGNRPNDFDSTSRCKSEAIQVTHALADPRVPVAREDLKRKFHQIHKENSPEARPFYCHFTTVTVSWPLLHYRANCILISILGP